MMVRATFDGACEPRNPGGHIGIGWTIDTDVYHRYIPAAAQNTNIIQTLRHTPGMSVDDLMTACGIAKQSNLTRHLRYLLVAGHIVENEGKYAVQHEAQ